MTLAALRALAFDEPVRRRSAAILVGVAIVMAGLAPPAATADSGDVAPTPRTSFSYDSAPGDFIGQGRSGKLVQSDDVSVVVTGTAEHLSMGASSRDEYWSAEISPGFGDTLAPGVYRHAMRDSFRSGRSPGLDARGNARGCNDVFGNFTVNQISFDAAGNIDMVDLTFVQHCDGSKTPSFTGTIHLNQLPLSYKMNSEPGDSIGKGERQKYLNSTSLILVVGSATAVRADVSGHRDSWSIELRAPLGTEFTPRTTYRAARVADTWHAGLDVTGNSQMCLETSGRLRVKRIFTDDSGTVQNLSVTFTQFCDGSRAALDGTLRYFA